MAFLPQGKVKQGFWIDWSHGQVLGSTLTTTTTTANVVVAILAIVVSLASIHMWHFILFSFYQMRAKKNIGDGLYRQQQALFRSMTSPEQTLWDFTKLSWTWRGKARNSILRSIGPVLAALIFSLGALAASLGSSFIVNTGAITVLVNSDNCGVLFESEAVVQSYLNSVASSAQDYAQNCYVNDITSGSCIKFVQPRLNFTITPAPCPFSSICIGAEENPAISLDTGYLDSNDDFGLNAHPDDRVKARKKTTCAPIKVSGYYDTVSAAATDRFTGYNPFPGEQQFQLNYGLNPGYQGTPGSHFSYDTYLSNFTTDYSLQTRSSGPSYTDGGTYIPIKQLTRSDADTVFIWVFSNSIQYAYPVDDPVFSAHKKAYVLLNQAGKPLNLTVYESDNPFGAVACAEQYQFCVTTSDGSLNCTDLGGLPQPPARAALTSNKNQLATFSLFNLFMFNFDMTGVGNTQLPLLTPNIVQQNGLQSGFIPEDEWKHEVNLWESYVLANIQTLMASHAIGPGVTKRNGSEAQFTPPPTTAGKKLCKAQKMMVEGGFANISVFGLAFTIAMAGVIVIADLLFLKIILFLGKSHKFWGFNIDHWIQDGVLQLQRKVYEGSGQGKWTRRDKEIPLTGRDDMLHNFKSDESLKDDDEEQPSDSSADKIVSFGSESEPSSTLAEKPSVAEDAETTVQRRDSVDATSPAAGRNETGTRDIYTSGRVESPPVSPI